MADVTSEDTPSKSMNQDSDEFTDNELESRLVALDMGLMAKGKSDDESLDEVIAVDPLLIQISQALKHEEEHDSRFLSEECVAILSNYLLDDHVELLSNHNALL